MTTTPSNPTGRAIDDPRATAYDRVREGDVPPFPPSNPRNAFDETGAPRNPAVSHPLPSKGFPDNDGDMAHRPVHQVGDHPDGRTYLIKHAGVLKGEDIPDSELPEDQRADMDYRERYEKEHPEAVAEDVSEPWGQPVDKYGYPLRKGADPDAQATGDSNPDNPDRETKSDRYLGEEDAKTRTYEDGTSREVSNAEDSANDGAGFPVETDLPSPGVDPYAGEGELLENLSQEEVEVRYKTGGAEGVREHSVKVPLPDGDLDVNDDGIPDIDPTPPDPEAPIDARRGRNTRDYGKKTRK